MKVFIAVLPELVRLLKSVQDWNDDKVAAAKIKQDLGVITDAFTKKDPEALRRLFNS